MVKNILHRGDPVETRIERSDWIKITIEDQTD